MKFDQVIGQHRMKEHMRNSVLNGRIPHAQLILGAQGCGNLALALAYTQFVLCKHRSNIDSCGECSTCKKVSSMIHPDVHFTFPFLKKIGEIELCSDVYPQWRAAVQDDPYLNYEDWLQQLNAENKQGNIPTKELRKIIKNISLKSYEGGMKVCLIWLPEYLGLEGNILLKILEEPPEHTLFLLVGSDLDDILGTILSRTQLLRVPPIDDLSLSEALQLTDGLSTDDANRLATIAQGDYRLARDLGKQAMSPHLDAWRQWMTLCFRRKMGDAYQWSDDTAALGREGVKSFLLYGIQVLRSCAVLPYLGSESMWKGAELDFVTKFNTLELGFIAISDMVDVLEKAMFGIERNGNPKVTLLDATYGLIQAISKKN